MNNQNNTLPEDINLEQIQFDEGKLGKGTYGIVRKALIDKREFAVKIISLEEGEFTFDECEKEKDILKKLTASNSAGIVQYSSHYYDVENRNYYIIMEYMNLGSLGKVIHKLPNKPFEWGTRLSTMRNVASGVEVLHKYNFVHFDIKSRNILLSGSLDKQESLVAKLADFGSSKSNTEICERQGTYMAPEVIRGTSAVMSASDIFSFALLLWEIGAWKLPFENMPFLKLLFRVSEGLRETIPNDFPKRYANLVTWGWNQAPEKRPTATEVISELAEIEKEMKISM